MRRFISLPLRVLFMTAFVLTLQMVVFACLDSLLVPIAKAYGPTAGYVAQVLSWTVSGAIAGTFTAWHYRHLAFALAAPLILLMIFQLYRDPLAAVLGWLAIVVSYCITGVIRSQPAGNSPQG